MVEIKGNEQNMKKAGVHQSGISSKEVKACFSTKHIWQKDFKSGKNLYKKWGKELEELIFKRDLPKKIVHHRQASQKKKPS